MEYSTKMASAASAGAAGDKTAELRETAGVRNTTKALQETTRAFLMELSIRNYSRRTIDTYKRCLAEFLSYIGGDVRRAAVSILKQFLYEKYQAGYSASAINLYLNAVKFFMRNILKRNEDFENGLSALHFAKRPARIPDILSKREVKALLDSIKNQKHRLLIALAYGAGLRVSEVVRLRICDVDFERAVVIVRQGKGNRDRITLFPEKLRREFDLFLKDKLPKGYGFPGNRGERTNEYVFASNRGGKLTERTAQKVFEAALRRAGIAKNATFHSLRHSFATHLIENGVDIRYVQSLLGHKNIRTTQCYTRVTNSAIRNIKSPL